MLAPLAPLVLGLPKGTYDPRNLTLWDRITNPDGVFLFVLMVVFLLCFSVWEWRHILRELREDRERAQKKRAE